MYQSSKPRPVLPPSLPLLTRTGSSKAKWRMRGDENSSTTLTSYDSVRLSVKTGYKKSKKLMSLSAQQQHDKESEIDSRFLASIDDTASINVTWLNGSQLEAIRLEILQKNLETEIISDLTALTQARMKAVALEIAKLKITFEEIERACASGQRSVSKLISINMTLIDTLQALGLQPSSDKGLTKLMIRLRSDLLPAIRAESGNTQSKLNDDIYSINAKLKAGIFIMSREYYWSKKSMKTTFGVYEELRAALRLVDQKNRYSTAH
jgi:hypothetical protein